MREYIIIKEIEHLLQAPEGCLQKRLYARLCERLQAYIQTDSLKQETERQQE